MTTVTQTRRRREDVARTGTYDVYIEIDCDCEELVDACGLDYEMIQEVDALGNLVDSTQNEICISLHECEYEEMQHDCNFNYTNEQNIGLFLLNAELSEYVTKATIYKPNGDKITFE